MGNIINYLINKTKIKIYEKVAKMLLEVICVPIIFQND